MGDSDLRAPRPLFHLAIPAINLPETTAFYLQVLGCRIGRETDRAVILDFFGHQVVLHHTDDNPSIQPGLYPRHFGIVFANQDEWDEFIQHLNTLQIAFRVPPKLRFAGEVTEHWSCFLADPSGNLLEFKWYRHAEAIFGAREWSAIGDRT